MVVLVIALGVAGTALAFSLVDQALLEGSRPRGGTVVPRTDDVLVSLDTEEGRDLIRRVVDSMEPGLPNIGDDTAGPVPTTSDDVPNLGALPSVGDDFFTEAGRAIVRGLVESEISQRLYSANQDVLVSLETKEGREAIRRIVDSMEPSGDDLTNPFTDGL